MRKQLISAAVAGALAFGIGAAQAAISADEVKRLQADLTPVGAERAGNADGTIPEWTGGLTEAPAGWQRGDDRPDPFADEQPLFTITAANAAQYADQLTPGMIALLETYPEFKMPVYKTHRTAAWPQYVYDNIAKSATTAELSDDGNAVSGVWGAVPFPIPKNGQEVIWNHNLRFIGTYRNLPSVNEVIIYNSGQRTEWTFANRVHFLYYDPNTTEEERQKGDIFRYTSTALTPARDAGDGSLALENVDPVANPRKAWVYDPAERRVRRAPNLAFDTPDRAVTTVDDYDLFSGSPERYDWKLVGKKEIYVPYNNNRVNSIKNSVEGTYTAPVINPDLTRYELHRVWVVEANVREDARHIYAKRVFYIDEDTWTILASDKYDGNGNLWRTALNFPVTAPEVPVTAGGFYVHYDLKVGAYLSIFGAQGQSRGQTFDEAPPPASFYTPAALRRRGR